jgi:hypothetical protein
MDAEQMMEHLLAEIRTKQSKTDANLKEMKACQEEDTTVLEAANKQRSKYRD